MRYLVLRDDFKGGAFPNKLRALRFARGFTALMTDRNAKPGAPELLQLGPLGAVRVVKRKAKRPPP